ncbi:MAG TPA: hypothetical protein VNM34_13340 [Verrucomicrobiae bacterium]|nr:hypothetical protein [Verrucomicrobiae bacterium]
MLRHLIGAVGATVVALSLSAGVAFAAQPGASCGSAGATMSPPGFNTSGFANAEANYAGSEGTASLAHSNSGNAVSQYDIACVHYTAAHS